MKKITVLLMVGLLLIGCGKSAGNNKPGEKNKSTIPDLIGEVLFDIQQEIIDLQVEVSIVYRVDYNALNGEILACEPVAGTEVDSGSLLKLVVNKTDYYNLNEFSKSFNSILKSNFTEKQTGEFFDVVFKEKSINCFSETTTPLFDEFAIQTIFTSDFFMNLIGNIIPVEPKDISGKSKLKNYLTTAEYNKYGKNKDFANANYYVYRTQDYQDFFDSIWGKNRVDVASWSKFSDLRTIISESGFLLIRQGYGDAYTSIFCKLDSIERVSGDVFIVNVKFIEIYDYYDEVDNSIFSIVDMSSEKSYPYINIESFDYYDMNYDDLIETIGFKEEIGTISIEIYPTEDGLRFWGNLTHDSWKPLYFVNQPVQVKANGGLRMRYGPGTVYDRILTIPNKANVIILGYSNDYPDWAYVYYLDKQLYANFGWVSSDFLE